jgi:hypothetical protein
MIIGGAVSTSALVPSYLAIRLHWNLTTPASLIGLAFAGCCACGIARTVWWKWVVVWAMMLGSVVIAFLPPSFFGTLADDSWVTDPVRTKVVGAFLLTVMMFGTMLLISGAISFWLYLRRTRPPAQEGQ